MAAASLDPSLTHQQAESGGISNVDDSNSLGAALDDYVHRQCLLSPLHDSALADTDPFQPNDYMINNQNDTDEATASALRDLAASLDEPHRPLAGDVLHPNNSTCPQKRQREEEEEECDETSEKRPRKPSVTVVEARRMMNEAVSTRMSARNSLQIAQSQLEACQQYVDAAHREVEQAENVVSEVSQQLCDELLQEDTSWNATYKILLRFRERHGHTNVPRNPSKEQKEADPNLSKLAGWVGRQRTNYRRTLEDERRPEEYQIIALERVGFDFDPHRSAWMKRYAQLKKFKDIYGHFDVLSMKNGSSSSDSDEEEHSSELEDSNHTTTSNESEATRYSSLATWMKRQQHQYRTFREGNPKSEMTEERIRLLDDIGFPWRKRAKLWNENYNALLVYKEESGNTQPPSTGKLKGLSDWTKNQRKQLKRYEEDPSSSSLSEEQVALLKGLPLDGDIRAASWSTRFNELIEFKERHGHCVLPTKYPLNQKLASWVSTQRRQYQLLKEGKPSQITEERINILTEADFEWKVSAQRREETSRALVKSFDEIYAELLERRNETGTLDVGKSGDLREWLNTYQYQLQLFQTGQSSQLTFEQASKLSVLFGDEPMSTAATLSQSPSEEDDERKPRAKSVPVQAMMIPTENSVVETHPEANTWEESYTELLTHRLTFHSFQIPTAHALYHWTQEQRVEYQKYIQGHPSSLTSERIRKLNFVEFPWNENGRSSPTDPQVSWEEMFAELLAFRIRFQSFHVPPENQRLHCWMATQRHMLQNHVNGSDQSDHLAKERIQKLCEIRFPWDDDDEEQQHVAGAGLNGYASVE